MHIAHFVRQATAIAAGLFLTLSVMAAEPLTISNSGRVVRFNSRGAIQSISCQGQEIAWPAATAAGEVAYGKKIYPLNEPSTEPKLSGRKANFKYVLETESRLEVEIETQVEPSSKSRLVLGRVVTVRSSTQIKEPLTIRLTALPEGLNRRWLPLKNGIGQWTGKGEGETPVYKLAGGVPEKLQRLALPLCGTGVDGSTLTATVIADPFFSAVFNGDTVSWTHPVNPGLENGEERHLTVTLLGSHTPDEAIDAFYSQMLPEIQPGPEWLHRIALVDYDYMSDGGTGWERDIEALAAAIPKANHGQVFLCLHGWYDYLGRYSFDSSTGKFDRTWTAFGSYPLVSNNNSRVNLEGTDVSVGFSQCTPVPMSLDIVHKKLAFARSHGFRVGMYFADGMNAGDKLADFTPDKVLRWGGWTGPDSKGKSYMMNPLDPAVHQFFVSYMQALLKEFGKDVDVFNWDETFHIKAGELGNAAYPGHADRAMMRLTHELTVMVQDWNRRHHRQVAFLTSDAIGPFTSPDGPGYALCSHGTYQDSHCNPAAWSFGIFPNYRNVLWSCCWWPHSKWNWVEFGVRSYQAPVSISDGWGDSIGFGESDPTFRKDVIDLFNWRKQQSTKLHWFEALPVPPAKQSGQ